MPYIRNKPSIHNHIFSAERAKDSFQENSHYRKVWLNTCIEFTGFSNCVLSAVKIHYNDIITKSAATCYHKNPLP